MADANSTSNKQTKENPRAHINTSASTLHSVISSAHLLHQTGYDTTRHAVTYVGNAEELSYLESAADASITTISLGISVIGKLLVSQDKSYGYVSDDDLSSLGWLLNDLGASIIALQNVQTLAGDAVTYAKMLTNGADHA